MHQAMAQNLSLELPSVWGGKSLRKIIEILYENDGFWRSMGLTDLAHSQNLNLDETSIWRSKIIEIPLENKGFQRSWGVTHQAQGQNLSLELPSVWGANSWKFHRKMKDSRGPGG